MKTIKVFFTFFIAFCCTLSAMDHKQNYKPIKASFVPEENQIRLVFMGKTGAGKSTIINAFYNFTKSVKWNDSKYFPILTDFHACNVKEYESRNVESHEKKQLQAVTKDASEYMANGKSFLVSLIDCPGMADPKGVKKDLENKSKIAKFVSKLESFNAICIVLPATVNRETAEAKYLIEEIKSIIPTSAHNRIFIIVTHTTTKCKNIEDFVQSVGLPTNNIFYFDNYALSRDGYTEDFDANFDDSDDDLSDPFSNSTATDNSSQNETKTKLKKVKETWRESNKQFNKVLKTAKNLGRYSSNDMKQISETKEQIVSKLIEAHKKVKELEKKQVEAKSAKEEYETTLEALNWAITRKNTSQASVQQAKLDQIESQTYNLYQSKSYKGTSDTSYKNTTCMLCDKTCHESCGLDYKDSGAYSHLSGCSVISNGYCTDCGCHYSDHRHRYHKWVTKTQTNEVNWVRERRKNANQNLRDANSDLDKKQGDVNRKTEEKNTKQSTLELLKNLVKDLKKAKKDLQTQIVAHYLELDKVCLSSINCEIAEYFNMLIQKEDDPVKIAKLDQSRRFYIEQVNLFKQTKNNQNY